MKWILTITTVILGISLIWVMPALSESTEETNIEPAAPATPVLERRGDRIEDMRDRREDVRDRREDVRDKREDIRDRKEDKRDKREDIRDEREDVREKKGTHSAGHNRPHAKQERKQRPGR